MASRGLNADKPTNSASQKTSHRIFTNRGREETRLRQDPATAGKLLMKGLKF